MRIMNQHVLPEMLSPPCRNRLPKRAWHSTFILRPASPNFLPKLIVPVHIGGTQKYVEILGSDPSSQKLAYWTFFTIRRKVVLDVRYMAARENSILTIGYREIWLWKFACKSAYPTIIYFGLTSEIEICLIINSSTIFNALNYCFDSNSYWRPGKSMTIIWVSVNYHAHS